MMKNKQETSAPKPCVCGKTAVSVKSKSGTMLICPDPVNCSQNIRTGWRKSGEANSMIVEWNSLVEQAIYRNMRNRRMPRE